MPVRIALAPLSLFEFGKGSSLTECQSHWSAVRLPVSFLSQVSGPPWQFCSLASCGLIGRHYPHCQTGNAPDDLSFGFIFELANPAARSRMRNQNELRSLKFAPGTHVAASQLDKVN